jgi:hypothetical protein
MEDVDLNWQPFYNGAAIQYTALIDLVGFEG